MERSNIIQLSLPTIQLIEKLKNGKIGDVISANDLNAACGRDVTPDGNGYANLQTAIRHCTKQYAIVWKWIRGSKTIKCLGPSEIVSVSESDRQTISRRAKASCLKLATIDDSQLSNGDRLQVNTQRAFMGSLQLFSAKKTNQLFAEKKITNTLPPASALDAFLNKKPLTETDSVRTETRRVKTGQDKTGPDMI